MAEYSKEELRILILKYGNAMFDSGTNLMEPRVISEKYDVHAEKMREKLFKALGLDEL